MGGAKEVRNGQVVKVRIGLRLRKKVLGVLRDLQQEVHLKFGVSHPLYNIQISPCDFCHITIALFQRGDHANFAASARASGFSPNKSLLFGYLATEDVLVRTSLLQYGWLLQELVEKRRIVTVSQKAFVARHLARFAAMDDKGRGDNNSQVRFFRKLLYKAGLARVAWIPGRMGPELVLISLQDASSA